MSHRDGNIASGPADSSTPAVPSTAPSTVPSTAAAAQSPTATNSSGASASNRPPFAEPALPETYGVDEVGVLCKDPWWYFVYWEVTEAGLEAARAQLSASEDGTKLVLRVLPAAGERRGRDGRDIRDIPVDMASRHGRRYLEAPRQNAVFRVAIGLLSSDGLFAPIAHSPTIRMPPQQVSGETSIEWLHVLPTRGDGRARERIVAASQKHSERSVALRLSEAAASDLHAEILLRGGGSDLLAARSPTSPTTTPTTPTTPAGESR